jgi:hypothetical protein
MIANIILETNFFIYYTNSNSIFIIKTEQRLSDQLVTNKHETFWRYYDIRTFFTNTSKIISTNNQNEPIENTENNSGNISLCLNNS